ncbi:beta-class carbonic anhydrase [Anaerorhabdus sp.]|uniref:beta-class carbonic anhydrase n=1 Tax=Anaerorhabdus sp. TaxID=1872524 RepID=UPI002FC92D5B
MSNIEELVEFNKRFVENKEYEKYKTTKYPSKKIAILSCMDTRLTELLPAALNIQNGDVKMIKNAGALISSPLGSVMRSLIIAIYELGVEEIMVINHYDCGMQNIHSSSIIEKMLERGIQEKDIELMNYLGMDIKKWLNGFDNPCISVKETVQNIKLHPLIPKDIKVSGFLIDPDTGRLDFIA